MQHLMKFQVVRLINSKLAEHCSALTGLCSCYFIGSEVTGSPRHGNAGKISIPVEAVPSINVSGFLPHKDESPSSCSPPASEGDVRDE